MANAEVENPTGLCIFHLQQLMTCSPLQTDHSDSVILEILIKLLYPKGPAKGCIFIKKFEVSKQINCIVNITVFNRFSNIILFFYDYIGM